MRLIDVDKLPVTCNAAIINGKLELDGWVSAKRIDEAPAVEAIPIEWLRMWFTKKASLIGITLMSEIESDWEKENGNIQDK